MKNILRIVGTGTIGVLHLTGEAKAHLCQAKKVFWLGTIKNIETFINENKFTGEDLTSYYQNNALDADNYRDIKKKILMELEDVKDIALILLGHPRLGVTIVQELQQESINNGFELIITPGISSFDAMINDLEMDPIEEGTCVVDANRLLLYNYEMEPCFNYFIYHVCSIGNSNTNYNNPTEQNAVYFLKQKLLKHFPSSHKLVLVQSRESIDSDSKLLSGTLENLEDLLKKVSFSSSLFVPGLLPKASRVNQTFLKLLAGEC